MQVIRFVLVLVVFMLVIVSVGYLLYQNQTPEQSMEITTPTTPEQSAAVEVADVTLYFYPDSDTAPADIVALESFLRTQATVKEVEIHTANDVLASYRSTNKDNPEALQKLEDVDDNPFNNRFDIVVAETDLKAVEDSIETKDVYGYFSLEVESL